MTSLTTCTYSQKPREIWRSWLFKQNCENRTLEKLSLDYAWINKRFTLYFAPLNRYFARAEYVVVDEEPYVCKDKLIHKSPLNTSADVLSLCNNSVLSINYDDDYVIFGNFLMAYVDPPKYFSLDYSSYRVEGDVIKICMSSNIDVNKEWSARNRWLKTSPICDEDLIKLALKPSAYTINKNLTVHLKALKENIKPTNYVLTHSGELAYICIEPGNNLPMCSDFDITIRYDEYYEVRNNFSILYKEKVYTHKKYRVTSDGIKICNSSDIDVYQDAKEEMKKKCDGGAVETLDFFYTVDKYFTVYFAPSNQYFTRDEYTLDSPSLYVCKGNMRNVTTANTPKEHLSLCNGSKINIAMNTTNASEVITYNGRDYFPYEYKNLANNTVIQICNSSDTDTQNVWKYRNFWVKMQQEYYRSCKENKPLDFLNLRYEQLVNDLKSFQRHCNTYFWKGVLCRTCVDKGLMTDVGMLNPAIQFSTIELLDDVIGVTIVYNEDSYSVNGSNGTITFVYEVRLQNREKLVMMVFLEVFLAGLSLSSVCLVVLLMFYSIFPQLRTLPGKNIMSLSFAYLLWNVFGLISYSIYLGGYNRKATYICAPWVVIGNYFSFNIFTNITVNIYHLQKTFCSSIPSTPSRAGASKKKQFLKYLAVGWGTPLLVIAIELVLIQTGVVGFSFSKLNMCAYSRGSFWMRYLYLSFSACLVVFDVAMFIVTGYHIRKKLMESNSILQNCNAMKKRRSFFMLLKLSTIAGFNWLPVMVFFTVSNPDRNLLLVFFVLTFLSGVYIAIAFVFTRKNYKLLRNKIMGRQGSDKIQSKNKRAKEIADITPV